MISPETITHGEARPRLRAIALCLVALAALSVVSRLPQLRSPNLLLDGDECVLGLMAKHVSQGRELPIFFYGQHYGFSTVEAGAGALAFLMFGTSAAALKSAMLALWTLGVLFLFLALARRLGTGPSFAIAAVFVLTPAWAVWSMKARGGYLTAFAATAVLMWLLAAGRGRRSMWHWVAAGVLTSVIYLAQPLWLPGILPFLVAAAVSDRRLSWLAGYLAAAAAPAVAARLATVSSPEAWLGPGFDHETLARVVPDMALQVYVNLTGSYYLASTVQPPGAATAGLAWMWSLLLPLALLLQMYRLAARRYNATTHLLFASIVLTLLAEALTLRARDGRYLLPLSAPLVLLVGAELVDLVAVRVVSRSAAAVAAIVLMLLGAQSMWEFRSFSFLWSNPPRSWSEARRMEQVLNYLKVRDVRYVFSMNGLLDPQLIFYSDEHVLGRSTYPDGRYPPYVGATNRALASGERVAVVGYTNTSGAPGCWDVPICTGGIENLVRDSSDIYTVDGKYFVYAGADSDLLEKLHFRWLTAY